jgi:two-component system, LytTR family, sensor kinase
MIEYFLFYFHSPTIIPNQNFSMVVNNYPTITTIDSNKIFINETTEKTWPLVPISFFILFYSAGLLLRCLQKLKKEETGKILLERDRSASEISFLRRQINPHFILNTLNNVYSLSITKPDLVPELILKLSSLLRYILYRSNNDVMKTTDELKIIEDYIQLQKLRLTEKVSLNYKLIHDPFEYRIEPLIVLTLLENAFKHGVDTVSDSFIDIVLVVVNHKLILRINNKITRPAKDEQQYGGGIGLVNIRKRLDIAYPNKYQYKVCTDKMIYSVFLRIELDDKLYSY